MPSQVVGSSFTDGALFPNYVNGRLLVAEDLATSQATLVHRDTLVGRAAGSGVVTGLLVTAGATSLTVAPGFGLTPSGEPVSVPAAVTLPLTMAGPTGPTTGASFSCCATPTAGGLTTVGSGPYVLTAFPACQSQGQAPMAAPPGTDTPVGCTAQWEVEGVQFKAIPLSLGSSVDGVTITTQNRRNLLAHWCYGSAQLAQLGVDPFNFAPAYTGLDSLSTTDLTPCDLPLCVFWWVQGSVAFVDQWSVRRRITRPDISTASWGAEVADERVAEGEARFLQFQDQVLAIVSAGSSRSTVAAPVFGLLPPVGFLPVALDQTGADIRRLYSESSTSSQDQTAELSTKKLDLTELVGQYHYQPEAILDPQVIALLGSQFAQLPEQAGFVPQTFFGALAGFGGILTWDVVYLALRQSYTMSPVATAAGSSPLPQVDEAQAHGGSRLMEARRAEVSFTSTLARQPSPYPVYRPEPKPFQPQPGGTTAQTATTTSLTVLTYYYVAENLMALLNAANGTGGGATPYVVFIKNQFWPIRTRPPIVTSPLR